jgi:hypothetical protein
MTRAQAFPVRFHENDAFEETLPGARINLGQCWFFLRGVLLAVFFSALVGIAFGHYPARKAAYLDPMVVVRFELFRVHSWLLGDRRKHAM